VNIERTLVGDIIARNIRKLPTTRFGYFPQFMKNGRPAEISKTVNFTSFTEIGHLSVSVKVLVLSEK